LPICVPIYAAAFGADFASRPCDAGRRQEAVTTKARGHRDTSKNGFPVAILRIRESRPAL
jgi:hypothetical protein